MSTLRTLGILLAAMLGAGCVASRPPHPQRPAADAEGNVAIPAFEVPFSSYASIQARRQFQTMLKQGRDAPPSSDITASRAYYDRINRDRVRRMRLVYPVQIQANTVGGVPVDVVTPAQGIAPDQSRRVLINLHGGAFLWGAHSGGFVESIPVASLGRIKVITVDYREAPEHAFPAASEDVEAVYRALLASYPAANIGIYGCSAGGVLTGEVVARLITRNLPVPGAIGTFCGSLVDVNGDSAYFSTALSADTPPAARVRLTGPATFIDEPYFKGANPDDPLVFPGHSRKLLVKFPPTLLITGTRDSTMSSMLQSQRLLTDAGVDAELHVWDGMWHSFFSDPEMPESKQAYAVIVKFFDRRLGH